MNQETLLTIFVGVSAAALLIQMFLLLAIAKIAGDMRDQSAAVMPQVQSILSKADLTLESSRKNIVEITEKANQITETASQMMDLAKAQMVKIDVVLTDATSRAKVQLERADLVLDDTVTRVHESVVAVHDGIVRPIREVQAVATGVKTAVAVFLRGGRPSVAQVTQDDEMFI